MCANCVIKCCGVFFQYLFLKSKKKRNILLEKVTFSNSQLKFIRPNQLNLIVPFVIIKKGNFAKFTYSGSVAISICT